MNQAEIRELGKCVWCKTELCKGDYPTFYMIEFNRYARHSPRLLASPEQDITGILGDALRLGLCDDCGEKIRPLIVSFFARKPEPKEGA